MRSADKVEVVVAVVGAVKSEAWYDGEREGGREVGSGGEFPVVGFVLVESVISIDTAIVLASLLEATGRERSGVGAIDTADGADDDVTHGSRL